MIGEALGQEQVHRVREVRSWSPTDQEKKL